MALDLNEDFPENLAYYQSFLVRVFCFNKRVYHDKFITKMTFNLKKKYNVSNFVSEQKITVSNCAVALKNHFFNMLWIVQMYKHRNFMDFLDYKKYKDALIRQSTTGDEIRKFFQITRLSHFTLRPKFIPLIYFEKLNNNGHICPIPICGKGRENYFGRLPSNELGIWHNNSYAWGCRKCPANYFQSNDTKVHSVCSPCPKLTLSTKAQDSCYDPYIKDYVTIKDYIILKNQPGLQVSFALCLLGIIWSFFTLIIFVRKKDTVVVRGSKFPIMMLHISSMICLFISIPLPFSILHKWEKSCLFEVLVIPIFVYFPGTLIFIKSQNLLMAFSSKLRLTDGARRRSFISQVFLALVMVLTSFILLFITMEYTPVLLQSEIVHSEFKRVMRCDVSCHIAVQVILIIFQHLMSTIQAYRGRNLPGPYNEAMPIVYSSFTSIVTYMTFFPFQFLQKDKDIKIVSRVLIITIANLAFVVIFYGSKLYIILMKPKQNTKEYLQKEMFELSKNNVDCKIK